MGRMLKTNTVCEGVSGRWRKCSWFKSLFFFFFPIPLWPETRDFQTIKYLPAEESFWDPGLNVTNYLLWSSETYIVGAEGEEEEYLEEKTCFKPSAAATCSPNYIAWQWDKLMGWVCSEQKKRWKIWDKCTKLKANCSKLPSSKVSCVWKTSPHNTNVFCTGAAACPVEAPYLGARWTCLGLVIRHLLKKKLGKE